MAKDKPNPTKIPSKATKPAKKKTASSPKADSEKRAVRYRSSCPSSLQERILRASTQRLYLIGRDDDDLPADRMSRNFTILGSTGNVYTVCLSKIPTCTCPDFSKKHDLCKHILFVTLKVIGIDPKSPLAYQRAYLQSELQELFDKLAERRSNSSNSDTRIMANESVRQSYQQIVQGGASSPDARSSFLQRRQPLDEDSECIICFDAMSLGSSTFCGGTCGVNLHSDCVRRWCMSNRTCPNCRQPWIDGVKGPPPSNNPQGEGFVNLGRLQGQSPVRDTSTYHDYYGSYGGRRGRRQW